MIGYFAMKSIGTSFEADFLSKYVINVRFGLGTPKTLVFGMVNYGKTKNFVR